MIGWEPTNQIGKREPVFFRLRVVPVTLGHLQLLHDAGFDLDNEATFEDLLVAVFVCSGDHKERRKDLTSWWAQYFFRFWGRICWKHNCQEETERFTAWLSKQLSGPITKAAPNGRNRESAAPMHLNLIACLMGLLGMSEDRALDTTVKRARQLVCAFGEARGEMELWSKMDEARRELSVKLGLVKPREEG